MEIPTAVVAMVVAPLQYIYQVTPPWLGSKFINPSEPYPDPAVGDATI